jgi:hypothetical protein
MPIPCAITIHATAITANVATISKARPMNFAPGVGASGRAMMRWDGKGSVGIGGSLTAFPLPHHRTYGSVSGGSLDYAVAGFARERSPSVLKKLVGMAMWSAGLTASRQGPWGLPAVFTARSRPTPQRRSSAKRAGPVFHCFQAMARNRRLSHSSSLRNTTASGRSRSSRATR